MRSSHVTQLGEPEEAIELVEISGPTPEPDEVRLRVEACALNRLDVFARLGHSEKKDVFPKQTGGDIAGVVDLVGADVDGWSEGDRAVVYPSITCGECEYCLNGEHTMRHKYQTVGEALPGGLAEYLVLPAETLDPILETMNFVTAAAWPVGVHDRVADGRHDRWVASR